MKQKYNELPIHVKHKYTQYEPKKELIHMDTTIRSQRRRGGGHSALEVGSRAWPYHSPAG